MKQIFNDNWFFWKGSLDSGREETYDREADFQPVELPHDWLIYDTENLYENSCGWYRKEMTWNGQEEERVFLRFDGVYMDSTLYVNGLKVGDWKYGYSTFDMEITDALHPGKNEVLLQVRFQAPNSRWYSGAGIYRNVWLFVCGLSYLPVDGTYISISPCGENYVLEAETEIAGIPALQAYCRYRLYKEGHLVQELGSVDCTEMANGKIHLETVVSKPELWDLESPSCYELTVELLVEEAVQDTQQITVGFRTMEFDPEHGFYLNGRNVKVHGVCEHHDFGCLGAAFSEAAMRRKFKILRGMGVNAIRTSHNMPAPELMELADRMGFLVMNEAFDMWERAKTTYDYARFFPEWAEKDVKSWIRRDRNHPSLMLWSIGNEIYDTHADAHGQDLTHRLVGYVREHDPKGNAPITIGSNYMAGENARQCADIVKFAGYNYGERFYQDHHAKHPDWIIYGSETASIVQSRGIYHFPLSQSILADEDEQCSALGNSSTSWGAKSIERCITDDRDAAFAFGQFLWTGFDYIGEPTPYHTKNSYFGQIDTAGFPKDAYYIFQSQWTEPEDNPMVHLFPYWDFNVGQNIDVRACTNGAEVELFVNGVSKGRQSIDRKAGMKLLGDWQVVYEPGIITAVAYDEAGKEIARDSRRSFGESLKLTMCSDQDSLSPNEKDLAFIMIGVLDENGNPVENAADYVTVSVEGPGRLLGLDNGDSTDYDPYKSCTRKLFSGKLLAVIGTTKAEGEILVKVIGDGLIEAETRIAVQRMNEETETGSPDTYLENCVSQEFMKRYHNNVLPRRFVRKIELKAVDGQRLTKEKRELCIEASICPKEAAENVTLLWETVNNSGILVNYASVEEERIDGNVHRARVQAIGDGAFRVRCLAKDMDGRIRVISQMELESKGLGQVFLNPYDFISAGLYTSTLGVIGNGNEKGIATDPNGISGVVFTNIDFGDYGSDEITLPIFSLSSSPCPVEIWLGVPYEQDARLLTTVTYHKKTIWNVYQEESFKLPERICGIASLAFVLRTKVHIKGFSFKKLEKAYEMLAAGNCDRVYGDSFVKDGSSIRGIGNNVTLEFEQMDFGESGADRVKIFGYTPLEVNTIHICFTQENGEKRNRIVEFMGSKEKTEQYFTIEPLTGKGKIDFIFLPGSEFDFDAFQFQRAEINAAVL